MQKLDADYNGDNIHEQCFLLDVQKIQKNYIYTEVLNCPLYICLIADDDADVDGDDDLGGLQMGLEGVFLIAK